MLNQIGVCYNISEGTGPLKILQNEVFSMKNDSPKNEEQDQELKEFRCPACLMADRCHQCNRLGTDGWCHEHGGWSDPMDLACDWYYKH